MTALEELFIWLNRTSGGNSVVKNAENELLENDARIRDLETALAELADRAEHIDELLLKFTNSPKECEIGEVTRARALLKK